MLPRHSRRRRVAYFAHIGGVIAGVLLVWLFRDRDAYERQKAARIGH